MQTLEVDKERFLVLCGSNSVRLPLYQFRVLAYLWDHPEFVRSRYDIVDHCWPDGISAEIYQASVNSTIKRLRQKLRDAFGPECKPISMYFGEGYYYRSEYRAGADQTCDDFQFKGNS